MLNNNVQIPNHKQNTISNVPNRIFDLEERTLEFSRKILCLCEKIKICTSNYELSRQVIRSGTSIGANYREANDSLSKKDFLHRMKIARKEAKETSYWLELLYHPNPALTSELNVLLQESMELRNILTAIIVKMQ